MDAITHTIIAVGTIAAAYYVGRWSMLQAVRRQQQLEIDLVCNLLVRNLQLEIDLVRNLMREARLAEMRGDFTDLEPDSTEALQLPLFTEKQLQQ